ncbi:MAG: hypothetical protein IKE28_05135 [Solobacterium sp.]|nr:hypothetical protein [Solobacterium sp.]
MSEENKTPDEVFEDVKKEAEEAAENLKKGLADAMDTIKDNSSEPIQSIEKTVEDLKKKIQNLSSEENGESKPGIDLKLSEENKEKIETIKNNTINTVNETIGQAKKAAQDMTNKEELSKTLEYLKANAMKAVDTAKETISNLMENADVKKTIDSAESMVKEFGEKTSKTIEGFLPEDKKESIRKGLEQAGEAVSETVDKTSKAIDEFVKKPEVQDTIEKTVTGAKDLANKGAEMIKDLLDKDEQK